MRGVWGGVWAGRWPQGAGEACNKHRGVQALPLGAQVPPVPTGVWNLHWRQPVKVGRWKRLQRL